VPDRIRGYEHIKVRNAQATLDYVGRRRVGLRQAAAPAAA
jgi:hypothetical protein